MSHFDELNLSNPLKNAIQDLGITAPTPIQSQAFPVILSGKDLVGISQTGTGKTFAYLMPLLKELKFSKEINPRVLILVPTRELVVQVVEQIEKLTTYMKVRALGIYGGKNINSQKPAVMAGVDVLVGTPGRTYDLVLHHTLSLKNIKKLVIDEVDVMLDLGFRFQLTNIFDMLPTKRQHIMFSATMTEDVDALIDDYFINPEKITIAVSGTPLENIAQSSYAVRNFYTKANLLQHLLMTQRYEKVLVFVSSKRNADRLFESLEPFLEQEMCIIHSNKSQNYRLRSLEQFNEGKKRILIATDVIARGLDINDVTQVISMDVQIYPENHMHRIGRTGRAEKEGTAILMYTEKERVYKEAVEKLMKEQITDEAFPDEVEISNELLPEERPKSKQIELSNKRKVTEAKGESTHEKKDKNKKVNLGGSYRRELAKKYKKPKTRGDKNQNKKRK